MFVSLDWKCSKHLNEKIMSSSENQPADTEQNEEEFDYGEEFFTTEKTQEQNKDEKSSSLHTDNDETNQPKESEKDINTNNGINKDLANSSTTGMEEDEASHPNETNEDVNDDNNENEEIPNEDKKETAKIKATPSETEKAEDSEKTAGEIQTQNADINTVLNGNQELSGDEWDELQLDTQTSKYI